MSSDGRWVRRAITTVLATATVLLAGCGGWNSKAPLIPVSRQADMPFDAGQYRLVVKPDANVSANPAPSETIPFYYDGRKQYRTDKGESPVYINVSDLGEAYYVAQVWDKNTQTASYMLIQVLSRRNIVIYTPGCEGFIEGLARFAGAASECRFADFESLKTAMKDLKRVAKSPEAHLTKDYLMQKFEIAA